MSDLLRDYAGSEPNIRFHKFSSDGILTGKFVDVKMETNKFSLNKAKPTYYVEANGFTYKFTSESKGLARQLADFYGKVVSIQRVGTGMETKFYVKEIKE